MDGRRPGFLKPEDGVLLTAHEAEHIVENLQCFTVDEVGSSDWFKQNKKLEKLNLQAHYNTIAHNDEFVMAALLSFDKMNVLIHELLVIEIWKEKIMLLFIRRLARDDPTIRLSLILYQEVTLIKLFEVMLFHREACEALGGDNLLEVVTNLPTQIPKLKKLADYCYRKLIYLNTDGHTDSEYKERSAQEILHLKPEQEMKEKAGEIHFACAISALSILRYLSDYMSDLPPGLMVRLIDTNDIIMNLVALVEHPPWVRRRKRQEKIIIEKYVEGKWVEIPDEDRFKLSQTEAQVWLALTNLIADSRCRAKYHYDDYRQAQVLKLRKYVNEMVLDQLPVLKDLQWALEEISLNLIATQEDRKIAHLIMEEVPQQREKLLSRQDWKRIAEKQIKDIQSDPNSCGAEEDYKEFMRMFEFGEAMDAPKCASCGVPAMQRCSRCKNEWYCGRDCQVSNWKLHKKMCDIIITSSTL